MKYLKIIAWRIQLISFFQLSFISFCLLFCFSCDQYPSDQDKEATAREQIMQLHDLQRAVHFEKRLDAFVDLLSEDHISVNRGEVSMPSKEELKTTFTDYFSRVEFEKWDDISKPIIRFSDDYSMAYTIVEKEVIVQYTDQNGENVRESTTFSWVAIYKRHGDEWKIDCVASTNKPGVILG